jgi:hypothetical protein
MKRSKGITPVASASRWKISRNSGEGELGLAVWLGMEKLKRTVERIRERKTRKAVLSGFAKKISVYPVR